MLFGTVFTDARPQSIQLGNEQIQFQMAPPSRLYWADRPAMRLSASSGA